MVYSGYNRSSETGKPEYGHMGGFYNKSPLYWIYEALESILKELFK
jgi:hypothetical protein